MNQYLIAVSLLALTGCAVWKPGEDPSGISLKEKASVLLFAIRQFHKDNGQYPTSLSELTPKYIQSLSGQPEFIYSKEKKTVLFTYSPSWPQAGRVSCSAVIGETTWNCVGYI